MRPAASGRAVWHAEKGPGSAFRGIEAATQIFWADGDRLVFPWERDGWLHLYSVSADGGRAQLLTPGDFEIEHVSLSRDRREAAVLLQSGRYRSPPHVARGRRRWQALADSGNTPRRMGEGIEWEPADVGADGMQRSRSCVRAPPRSVARPSRSAADLFAIWRRFNDARGFSHGSGQASAGDLPCLGRPADPRPAFHASKRWRPRSTRR